MINLLFFSLFLWQDPSISQYVQYQEGNMPLVISAPHDGHLKPGSMADRKSGVKVRDLGAGVIAKHLSDEIYLRSGRRPYLITTTLHRIKCDMNREIGEAAQGDEVAEKVWREYHQSIKQALASAKKDGGGKALLIDIHGHGHPNDWIEVGHAAPLDGSEWISGATSVGAYLSDQGFKAVPSPEIPDPGEEKYFSGGYITRHYRTKDIRTIQFELSSPMRKKKVRLDTAQRIANALSEFIPVHFVMPKFSPEVEFVTEENRYKSFYKKFNRAVDVFGLSVLADKKVKKEKIQHQAWVMNQYLDNDQDGFVDNYDVVKYLQEERAYMFITSKRFNPEEHEGDGWHIAQDCYEDETLPDGLPFNEDADEFDATLEEVWHLISNGYVDVYPDVFGLEPESSKLSEAMDVARGGQFYRVPRKYPRESWYSYYDRTCDYQCMAMEYFYWGMTTLLGAQSHPLRAEQIRDEWRLPTPELLRAQDKLLIEILEGEEYKLPTRLPTPWQGQGVQ
jgi:N-formylglutamate amidohydrolase